VKRLTRDDCEKKYEAAAVAYRRYLDQSAKDKFGTYTQAAKELKRSRAHLNDCISGKRGVDSVRRLSEKLEALQP
jgi:hypothetical protein